MIEVDEQGALTLTRCGTLDVVRQFADVVVALRLHGLGQQHGGLVGILPSEVKQTVVSTEAGSLQRYFLRGEGQAEVWLDDETDGVALVGCRTTFLLVLLGLRHKLRLILTGTVDREVAAVGHLAGDEVVVSLAEICLLTVDTKTEVEECRDRLVVEGDRFVLTAFTALVGDGYAVEIHLAARLHH